MWQSGYCARTLRSSESQSYKPSFPEGRDADSKMHERAFSNLHWGHYMDRHGGDSATELVSDAPSRSGEHRQGRCGKGTCLPEWSGQTSIFLPLVRIQDMALHAETSGMNLWRLLCGSNSQGVSRHLLQLPHGPEESFLFLLPALLLAWWAQMAELAIHSHPAAPGVQEGAWLALANIMTHGSRELLGLCLRLHLLPHHRLGCG